jgi:hypothetical protein
LTGDDDVPVRPEICESQEKCNLSGRAEGEDIPVDTLDDKIANILDSSIATLFIQRPGGTDVFVSWSCLDLGNQSWIAKLLASRARS